MPLDENEQRIIAEIEQQFHADDPVSAHRLESINLVSYLSRNCRWSLAGLVAGLVVVLAGFSTSWLLGVVGFLIMVASGVALVQNLRRIGKVGLDQVSRSLSSQFGGTDELSRRLRRRFGNRED